MTIEGHPRGPSEIEDVDPNGDTEAPPLSFDELPLPEPVRAGIRHAGFTECTPIQAKVLPLSLGGRDVAGQAQTGTGKTAAFLITVFTRLLESGKTRRPAAPRALVIAPTRELAVQIAKDAEVLGHGNGLTVQAVYGGVDYRKQRESLRQDVDLLVGTPGRLIDYLKQKVYDLRAIEVLVIDEADRMFDMGFIRDLRFLLRRCSPVTERQSMLFSATLSHDVLELAYMFMNDAVRVAVKPEQVTAERVQHLLLHVGVHEKFSALLGILEREGAERTLIFSNMRRTADDLCRTLSINGYTAEQITGDIDQRKRLKILESFRDGTLPILVATDVASRGLHIDGVTHVINFDLPLDPEDYVHRVGRTARAGASGTAISLACERYVDSLEAIEGLIGFKIPFEFPDESLLRSFKPAPRQPRRREGGPRRDGRDSREGRGGRDSRGGPRRRSTPFDSPPPADPSSERRADKAREGEEGDPAAKPGRSRGRRRSGERADGAAGKPSQASATPPAPMNEAASAAEGSATGQAPAKKRRRRRRRRGGGSAPEGAASETAARDAGSSD
ncbi:MAG: DEAD/DEAH box helicase [Deltaproteobacteria bacterium]|nr:DEAD/DEAH box helicase [Deltaproteobacteria bacterium]